MIDRTLRALALLTPTRTWDRERVAHVAAWIDLIRTWGKKTDLTAARDDDELVDLMVADAAILAAALPPGARVVDVGSGAGAPGLPLGLLRADLAVTLVEPLEKRVMFLRTAIGSLASRGLAPIPRVVRGRGEDLVKRGETFDVAVSRATLAPAGWLELGRRLAPAGDVWLLLAQDEPPESAGAPAERVDYAWPLTGAERKAVRYRVSA
ncbi:MAG TPA: RsmG family class I SAM-dependent methyltransferase [Polyangiaceae bacterium]|nr:RsmG family class I SAM-dependent methyltransferase [Polyangiaceae bacterium]